MIAREPSGRRMVAVAAPVLVVAAAYVLWWISDRLGAVGPLDRAAFGWVVVVPLWLAAPFAAGLAWRRFGAVDLAVAAIAAGSIVGAAAAFLFWQAVAHPACVALRAPVDWIAPSLVMGALHGGGLVAGGLVASASLRARRPVLALLAGAGLDAAFLVVALIVLGFLVAAGPNCQRIAPLG